MYSINVLSAYCAASKVLRCTYVQAGCYGAYVFRCSVTVRMCSGAVLRCVCVQVQCYSAYVFRCSVTVRMCSGAVDRSMNGHFFIINCIDFLTFRTPSYENYAFVSVLSMLLQYSVHCATEF